VLRRVGFFCWRTGTLQQDISMITILGWIVLVLLVWLTLGTVVALVVGKAIGLSDPVMHSSREAQRPRPVETKVVHQDLKFRA
jgi:hypothetical protein